MKNHKSFQNDHSYEYVLLISNETNKNAISKYYDVRCIQKNHLSSKSNVRTDASKPKRVSATTSQRTLPAFKSALKLTENIFKHRSLGFRRHGELARGQWDCHGDACMYVTTCTAPHGYAPGKGKIKPTTDRKKKKNISEGVKSKATRDSGLRSVTPCGPGNAQGLD
jgi:hypothetical protein